MVSESMRETARRSAHCGELDGDGVLTGSAEHVVCGDVMEFDLRVSGSTMIEVTWRASGCPATTSVAAIAAEVWSGSERADAGRRLRERLGQLGGLARHEAHAEKTALRALEDAWRSAP